MSIELAARVKEGRALYVLIPLLLLHLTLLSLQIEDPGGTLLIKRWVLTIEAPFLNLSSIVSTGVGKAWYSYFWLRGVRAENQHLQNVLRQLSLQANRMAEVERENMRLRKMVALIGNTPFDTIGARVVGRTPNYLSNVIYINRGSSDGIRLDSPALSGNDVIGRIVLITGHNAQIQLITNADASVGVMVDSSRSPGVLRGSGNALLDLNYISNAEPVNVGDMVVTSGLDGIYPKGLPVGNVVESRKGASVFREIKVEPSADLVHLEEVFVIPGKPLPEKTGEVSTGVMR